MFYGKAYSIQSSQYKLVDFPTLVWLKATHVGPLSRLSSDNAHKVIRCTGILLDQNYGKTASQPTANEWSSKVIAVDSVSRVLIHLWSIRTRSKYRRNDKMAYCTLLWLVLLQEPQNGRSVLTFVHPPACHNENKSSTFFAEEQDPQSDHSILRYMAPCKNCILPPTPSWACSWWVALLYNRKWLGCLTTTSVLLLVPVHPSRPRVSVRVDIHGFDERLPSVVLWRRGRHRHLLLLH
jgi:hypothetical protein